MTSTQAKKTCTKVFSHLSEEPAPDITSPPEISRGGSWWRFTHLSRKLKEITGQEVQRWERKRAAITATTETTNPLYSRPMHSLLAMSPMSKITRSSPSRAELQTMLETGAWTVKNQWTQMHLLTETLSLAVWSLTTNVLKVPRPTTLRSSRWVTMNTWSWTRSMSSNKTIYDSRLRTRWSKKNWSRAKSSFKACFGPKRICWSSRETWWNSPLSSWWLSACSCTKSRSLPRNYWGAAKTQTKN